jgi:hypothetical protein
MRFTINANNNLLGKSEENRPFRRIRCRNDDNIKMNPRSG